MTSRAVIFGCSGAELTRSERTFFRDADPWAFILFARNVETPTQVKRLCTQLRETVGRDALIFIDQEGGRVRRLKEPIWPFYPSLGHYAALDHMGLDARRAVWLHHRLIAHDLLELGITANCAPVLDIPQDDADPIISDRALGRDPDTIISLAHAAMAGMMSGGVVPVIKHIPGHGRATVDSHVKLPTVNTESAIMKHFDYKPFMKLADAPMAMTAHIVYSDVDRSKPLSVSKKAVSHIVRDTIGFDGLLMSDDIGMKALNGSLTEISQDVLSAGCDVVLHCDGELPHMVQVAAGTQTMNEQAARRALHAEICARDAEELDVDAAREEFRAVLSTIQGLN